MMKQNNKKILKQKNEEYERSNDILNNKIKNLEDKITEEKIKKSKLQIYSNNMNKIDENTKNYQKIYLIFIIILENYL